MTFQMGVCVCASLSTAIYPQQKTIHAPIAPRDVNSFNSIKLNHNLFCFF
jgi:hypothetical protein